MTKIALTGATGFIGSAVLKQLLSDGHEAVVLLRDESNTTRIKSLPGYQTVYYQDLAQETVAETLALHKPDAFIHLAWRGLTGSNRDEPFQITENLRSTLSSVELAHAVGCRHWIGIGSQAEYGNPNCKVIETAPALPTALYGKAKLAACWASLGLSEGLHMKSSWVRIFSTYGLGDEPAWFIPYIISEMKKGHSPRLTKCEQLWDYLYVDDAARAILSVLYREATGVFNIGSGRTVSLKSVVELIRQAIDPTIVIHYGAVPYRSDQVMHLEADIAKIQQSTGWVPEISIEEGLKKTVIG